MTADEAYRRVANQLPPGLLLRFYSPGHAAGLGKGKIYDGIRYAVFDPQSQTFLTAEGLVYVLTHECDVEQENERVLNEEVLVCPIIRLEDLVAEYQAELQGERLPAFLGNLGARLVSRVVFLPRIDGVLPHGGVLYLNQITHTHVTAFERGRAVCAVTAFGLQHVEYSLENHLLRPKADRLTFSAPPEVATRGDQHRAVSVWQRLAALREDMLRAAARFMGK